MSVFEFHQEMTLNQCFVQVGQDRIEKILTSSQFQVLSNRLTINIKSISTAQINSQDTEDRVAGIVNQDFLLFNKKYALIATTSIRRVGVFPEAAPQIFLGIVPTGTFGLAFGRLGPRFG